MDLHLVGYVEILQSYDLQLWVMAVLWIKKPLNLDLDPGYWLHLDLDLNPAPDPGLPVCYFCNLNLKEKIRNNFSEKLFSFKKVYLKKLSMI